MDLPLDIEHTIATKKKNKKNKKKKQTNKQTNQEGEYMFDDNRSISKDS